MVKTIKKCIKSMAIMSDNDEYRYMLTRTWDKYKPKATVIMLNPSKADVLKTDKTVMNVTNFLIENGYGSLTIVNLFAFMATDPRHLTKRDQDFEVPNDYYLKEAFHDADVIIVAWIRDEDKYVTRKREVETLLIPHQTKVKCFKDNKGRELRHPRDLAEDWILIDYELKFI